MTPTQFAALVERMRAAQTAWNEYIKIAQGN